MRETIKENMAGDINVDNAQADVSKYLEKHGLVYPKVRLKNKVVIDGAIAYVYVRSKIYENKSFVVDTKFLPIIEKFVWFYKDGYAVANIQQKQTRKTIRMHRLITASLCSSEIVVDHMNGDKNDNRECNLRICIKGQDADNQANTSPHFEFPEVVDVFKWSKHRLYIMEVSDGLYNKVLLPYVTFKELIKDRRYLYEYGMNHGLPQVVYRKSEELFTRLDSLIVDSSEYILCSKFINHFLIKRDEAGKRAKTMNMTSLLLENGLEKEDIVLDKPLFLRDGTLVVFPSGKSSKEKFHSKVYMKFESNINGDLTSMEQGLVGEYHDIES